MRYLVPFKKESHCAFCTQALASRLWLKLCCLFEYLLLEVTAAAAAAVLLPLQLCQEAV
jgi:hypothetical protein